MLPTELKELLSDFIKSDSLTNAIAYIKTDNLANNKTNSYPLVNLDFIDSTLIDGVFDYFITITALQKRRNSGKLTVDTKTDFENFDDNINDTFIIANSLIDNIKSSLDLELLNVPKITFLRKYTSSELDGCRFDLNIRTLNNLDCLA